MKAIDSYAKKIEELSSSSYSGNEDARNAIRLSLFLRGLKPEIRKEIRRQTPENIEEAVRAARNLENILTLESAEQGNIVAAVQQLKETFRHWNRNRDGLQDHSNRRHYSPRRYNNHHV
ncbi:hypothetical protein CRE_09700 [Caenorhabditis remanei]|uniref:Uncharacterized protein n=1 Tax=Caenorhabditis remanei TaxID=31234 RepID=E3MX34_CAERE|nr:hypothetical protein CRE_09700 [Caenorhabditis remanei]